MQFAVPQFTDVEDRLIGPLTLKQFLVLLGTGGLVMFFWSVLGPSFIFFLIALPISVIGIAAALGKYNGRPLFAYLMPFAGFISSTKVMIFKREVNDLAVAKSEIKKTEEKTFVDSEPTESRLKKLAYMLDQTAQTEKGLASNADQIDLPKLEFKSVVAQAKQDFSDTRKTLQQIRSTPTAPRSATLNYSKPSPKTSTGRYVPRKSSPKSPPKKFDPSSFLQGQ